MDNGGKRYLVFGGKWLRPFIPRESVNCFKYKCLLLIVKFYFQYINKYISMVSSFYTATVIGE